MSYFRNAQTLSQPPTLTDCNYAFWAHMIAAIAALCSGGLLVPLLAPFMVLLFTDSRHPFLMFHLNQAVLFQLLIHGIQIVLGVAIWFIAFVTCGIGLPLVALLIFPWLTSIVVPVLHAFRARDGEWSAVPFVGEYILAMERPFFT